MAASRTLAKKSRDAGEDENFRRASALVNEWVRKGEDLDLDKLQALSRILLEGTGHRREAGRLREADNSLTPGGRHVFFGSWENLPAYLEDLMTWYDGNKRGMHPVKLAALTYQQFVRIHPLVNANGRTGRLVMDFILQRNGYLPPSFDEPDTRTILDHAAVVIEQVGLGIRASAAALPTQSTPTSAKVEAAGS